MDFIEELKTTCRMQIRPSSKGSEYLEAVIDTKDIGPIEAILIKHLGDAHKVPGQAILFDDEMRSIIDAVGGLMIDQTLFYRKEAGKINYAMLWPWQSNPAKVTLKAGIVSEFPA